MKVFIAGATGVLGRRIVKRLIAGGHSVAGLCRSRRNREWLQKNGAEARDGDLFDGASLTRITSDSEAIVHMATAIPVGARPGKDDWRLNDRIRLEGTENLLCAAVANRCGIYVQQSVTFLYGDRQGAWTDESTAPAATLPEMLRSAVEMEAMVRRADAGNGLTSTILRFGSLYAHDAAHTDSMFSQIRKRRLPLIGDGAVYWNPIHADDAAEAVVNAIENHTVAAGKTYNICDDKPVLLRQLTSFIAKSFGARTPRYTPPFLARLLIGGDSMKFLSASARCRNDGAKRDLGWSPSFATYKEGVSAEIALWLERAGKS